MEAALEGHRRYLAALVEACRHRPSVHSHQLAALEREVALAAEAADLAGYRAASGDLFELTRAAWLDRLASHARAAATVDDRWFVEAAVAEHAEALEATGHAEWVECVARGSARASELLERGADARASFVRLLHALLVVRTTQRAIESSEARASAAAAHGALRMADPAWSGLSARRWYADRVPWTDDARALVEAWIDELDDGGAQADRELRPPRDALAELAAGEQRWRNDLARRGEGPTTENQPTVEDVLAPYRALAETTTADDPGSVAVRGAALALVSAGADAPTGQHALACFAEEGLLVELAAAPVRARAAEGLERQSLWPEPLAEYHWRTLLERLAEARTPTEVELIAVHADACLAVEADWNVFLFGGLAAPLFTACRYGWEQTEDARLDVGAAAATTLELHGLGPRALVDVPRLADFVAGVLTPLAGGAPGLAAREGEAGFEFLAEAQAWFWFLPPPEGLPSDPAAMRAALLRLLDEVGVTEPEGVARPVVLWGERVELADLNRALAAPRRPDPPGFAPIPGFRTGL